MKIENEIIALAVTAAVLVLIVLILSGCTTTKLVEVPVPVPCSKPKNIPVPHDYLSELSGNVTAKQFVPACLATIESYKHSYEAYEFINK